MKSSSNLREFLQSREISTGIHYALPIYLQRAYGELGLQLGTCPIAEKCMGEIISLPIFPELTEKQIHYVCESIKEWKDGKSK